jgi:hypothetical protein
MIEMPYISKERRKDYDYDICRLVDSLKYNRDHVTEDSTYIVYKLIKEVFGKDGYGWITKSNAIRVLDCAKEEYRRKVLNPHEDDAIKRNGDI